MKIKSMVLIIGVILMCLLGACSHSKNEAYDNAMTQGEKYVKQANMEKAEDSFEMALTTNKNDPRAKAYLNQVKEYNKAQELKKEKQYEKAQKLVKGLPYENEGLNSLEKAVNKLESSLSGLIKEEKSMINLYQDAKNESEKNNYKTANDKLEKLLKKDTSILADQKLIETAEKLLNENKAAIKKEAEKEVVTQKEQQRTKEKADTTSNKLINNAQEAQAYIQKNMPQAGSLTYTSEEEGIYYFSAVSGLADWIITVDSAGNFTEEVVSEETPNEEEYADSESWSEAKILSGEADWITAVENHFATSGYFDDVEIDSYARRGDYVSIYGKNKATGIADGNEISFVNRITGEISY